MKLSAKFATTIAASAVAVAQVASAGTLDDVKARGNLLCGVSTGAPGFATVDDSGKDVGFDVDYCRALAAAIFGDPMAVKFVGLTSAVRFTALAAGEVDILARNTTWTYSRDTDLKQTFLGVNYYDGQGFMVKKDLGVNSTLELDGATDLVTATLDFALDYDPDLTTANATIAAGGYSSSYTQDLDDGDIAFNDLESLTLTGDLLDLYVDGTELVSLSIDATMHDLTITGATDLTSLTVASGSKIGNITLTGTTNLAVADFNHTSNLTDTDATAQKSVTLSATNNTGLTKLHSTGDDVDTLTITGNTALAELDFTGLADDGAETTPTPGVTIWGNALVAVSAANTSDGETDKADGLATDL